MTKTVTNDIMGTKKVEVERTWEYQPILGNILGYWKNVKVDRIGSEIYLKIDLEPNDKLFINGKEILKAN